MNRTASMLVPLLLATSPMARAQGLTSGTGMQPSTQLAIPPNAPAIDRPGAEQRALAQHTPAQHRDGTRTTAPAPTTPH